MIIPKNWDEVEAKEVGDFTNLSLGAHICKILDVCEYTSEMTGNTSLRISVDIEEGEEFDGYFKKQYVANTDKKKKWPSAGTRYLSIKDEQMAYLKGFITAVNNSNSNSKITVIPGKELDYKQFKDKKIVGVFGLEEYEKQDGEIKTATKLVNFRSLDKLPEIEIPRVKLLSGEYIDYDDYMEMSHDTRKEDVKANNNNEISNDMLPF